MAPDAGAVIDGLARGVFDWFSASPVFRTLLLVAAFDFVFGTLRAIQAGQLNSSIASHGLLRKFAMILAVPFAEALEPYAGGVQLSEMVAGGFVYVEAVSVLEHWGALGLPIPQQVVDILGKLPGAPTRSDPPPAPNPSEPGR